MEEFLQIALTFPTVVFSAMMTVMVMYWFLVILGALDLEMFDLDLDLDMDGEVDVELDVDVDAEADAIAGPGLIEAVMGAMGLGTVPVTIVASFWVLLSWMISFSTVYYLAPIIGGMSTIVAVAMAAGSFAAAIPVNMLLMQPFIQFFRPAQQKRGGDSLIGSLCEVTTGKVTETFGQARVKDDGAGLVLAVRCDPDNGLARGSKALVIEYDKKRHAYIVEPYDKLIGTDSGSEEVVLSDDASSAQVEKPSQATAEDHD